MTSNISAALKGLADTINDFNGSVAGAGDYLGALITLTGAFAGTKDINSGDSAASMVKMVNSILTSPVMVSINGITGAGAKYVPYLGLLISGVATYNDYLNLDAELNKESPDPTAIAAAQETLVSDALGIAASAVVLIAATPEIAAVALVLTLASMALSVDAAVSGDSATLGAIDAGLSSLGETIAGLPSSVLDGIADSLSGMADAIDDGADMTMAVANATIDTLEMDVDEFVHTSIDSGIGVAVNNLFRTAVTPPRRDPLAIDLDGDGIETTAVPTDGSTPILFDHNADGIRTGTGWVKRDDAWLALDRDGNGSIDTGRELFGVDTEIVDANTGLLRNASSGFEALKAQDGNGDQLIDANDAVYSQLRLWRDLNQDGQSQAGELFTLQQLGIQSISLVSDGKTKNLGNGNTVTGSAKVSYTNGSSTEVDGVSLGGDAGNLNLSSNPFYREFTDAVPLTDTASALPGMGGSGVLRDLQEAMSLGTSEADALVAAVQAFGAATTREEQLALLDELLVHWAGTGTDLNTSLVGKTRSWSVLAVTNEAASLGRDRYAALYGSQLDAMGISWRDLLASADFRSGTRNDAASQLLDIAVDAGLMTRSVDEQSNGDNYYVTTYTGTPLYTGIDGMSGLYQRISVLQEFNGTAFLSTQMFAPSGGHTLDLSTNSIIAPTAAQTTAFDLAYDALRESVYSALVVQTRLKPYLDAVELVIDDAGIRFDSSATGAMLAAAWQANPEQALTDLVELNRYAFATLNAVEFDGTALLRGWVDSLAADSPLRATLSDLGVQVGASLVATDGSDMFLGDSGANSVSAGDGNDLLDEALLSNCVHQARRAPALQMAFA